MAFVTRDSSSAGVGMERASMRDSYVRGLMVGARERRERRRSLRVWSWLSSGRLGVAISRSVNFFGKLGSMREAYIDNLSMFPRQISQAGSDILGIPLGFPLTGETGWSGSPVAQQRRMSADSR